MLQVLALQGRLVLPLLILLVRVLRQVEKLVRRDVELAKEAVVVARPAQAVVAKEGVVLVVGQQLRQIHLLMVRQRQRF